VVTAGAVLIETAHAAATVEDYLSELAWFQAFLGEALTVQDRQEVFRLLIQKTLLLNEAAERGIDRRPEIRERIRAMTEQMVIQELVREMFGTELDVTDTEILAFYEKNRARFVFPERRTIYCVTLETETAARKAHEEASRIGNFSDILKKYAVPGSDTLFVGVTAQQLLPEFARPVFEMPLAFVSRPIPTPIGWHVAYVARIEPARPIAFEEVREPIRKYVFGLKRGRVLDPWIEEMQTKKKITIHGDRARTLIESGEPGSRPGK